MSHQSFATAWSSLTELRDLTTAFRDSIGNLALGSLRSTYDPENTPSRFLEYAHELAIIFDAVRFVCKVDSKHILLLQKDLVSATAHFLNFLSNECAGEQALLKSPSQRLIISHTLCSAVAALRACAWDCDRGLRSVVCKYASKFLANAPVKDNSLWLLQTLASLLLSHYSSDTPVGQGNDTSFTRWKMLYEAKDNEPSIIRDMVQRAMNMTVAAAERIWPMLDLCQLYWDTDLLLIQAAAGLKRDGVPAKVFYVPNDTDALTLALQNIGGRDVLQTQMHIMFRPGLSARCVMDTCSCAFDFKCMQGIASARSARTTSIRTAIEEAWDTCACRENTSEFFETIHIDFARRIQRQPRPQSGQLALPPRASITVMESHTTVDEILPLRIRQHKTQHVEIDSSGLHDYVLASKTETPKNVIEPVELATSEGETSLSYGSHTELDASGSTQPRSESYVAELEAYSPFEEDSPVSNDSNLNRNTSIASSTTSSTYSSRSSTLPLISTVLLDGKLDHCLPEPVYIEEQNLGRNTWAEDLEKACLEVAANDAQSPDGDTMSIFSDAVSTQMTLRSVSVSQMSTPKRFGFFRSAKRGSNHWIVPSLQFFASARHLIAWTKIGGIVVNVGGAECVLSQSISFSDIVCATGGTSRFSFVARTHEAYILNVFELGGSREKLKMHLARCPRVIAMSPNDQYIALKYLNGVRIINIDTTTKIDHKLPKMDSAHANAAPRSDAISFAHDSQSFMASTRFGPEKVISVWAKCIDMDKPIVVHSKAPCGNVDDHGLSSLHLVGPDVHGVPCGFLSTFTEKGLPVMLSMGSNQPYATALRSSNDMVGSRIHGSALKVDTSSKKSSLVIVNHNNDVFWVSDAFGRSQDIQRFKPLKRAKSMKPEVLVGMANTDEANIFWVDPKSRCGMLVKVGRAGGMTRPTEIRLDVDALCNP